MAGKAYSLKEVQLVFNGINLTNGLVLDGDAVTVTPTSRYASLEANMESAVFVLRNDRTGTITATMHLASNENDRLNELLQEQIRTNIPASGPIMVKNYLGRDLHQGDSAIIDGPPEVTYGDENAPRVTWTFLVCNLRMNLGGSDPQ